MAQPFGAADRSGELHYCSTARCRCESLTHDFSPLIGGHGLYCGSDALSERIVDERLVSHPGSSSRSIVVGLRTKSGAPRRHVPSRRQPTTRRSRSCPWLSSEPRLATTRLQS
jgi:hypothetical protein